MGAPGLAPARSWYAGSHGKQARWAGRSGELHTEGVAVTHIAPGFVESEIRRIDNAGKLRDGASEPMPRWLVMPTKAAARQIMDAIVARRAEAIVTGHAKLGVSLARHAPELLNAAVARLLRRSKSAGR